MKFKLNILSRYSNATLFWNGLVYVAFIVVACISLEAAGCLSALGSLFLFACMLDDAPSEETLWAPITILFWIMVLFVLIVQGFCWLIQITIVPFNNWLNNKRKS